MIESGVKEIDEGRPLAAALCARVLLEDAALLYVFSRDLLPMLERRDTEAIDKLVFPRALATRQPKHVKQLGEEIRARNVLTALDKMTIDHPNIRARVQDAIAAMLDDPTL
ncbi:MULTISPECIES: hypothetical protein [unclassified Bradyrhizobium]